eukprot:3868481-Rhodomonas_salina.3
MSGTDIPYGAASAREGEPYDHPMRSDVRYWPSLSQTMCSTDIAYAVTTRCPRILLPGPAWLSAEPSDPVLSYAMSGTGMQYFALPRVGSGSVLRPSYAIFSTDMPYDAMQTFGSGAVLDPTSSTDMPCAAAKKKCAMSSADISYGAIQSLCLSSTQRTSKGRVFGPRGLHSRCCAPLLYNGVCGTGTAYRPLLCDV